MATNSELEARVQETQRKYLHTEKLAATGTLSASIAHEMSNPLQAVMTFLQGLRRLPIFEKNDQEVMESVIGEVTRMKNFVRRLNDLNRPSSENKVTQDVRASIDYLLLLSKSDFKRRKISTVLHYAELPQIQAVPDQIKQVLLNLLKNAADACPDGGVVTISTWQEEGRVAVSIQDNGVGIPPEQLESIFQPFYTTKPEGKGTGLGLSVCQEIVQNHQGEIRVKSQPGEGSTFTVLLPVNA